MKIKELYIQQYHQFNAFHLDLTYPTGHPKAGQALDKVCFIGQSGTGKTSLLEVLKEVLTLVMNHAKRPFSLETEEFESTFRSESNRPSLFDNEVRVSFDNDINIAFHKLKDTNDSLNAYKTILTGINETKQLFLNNQFQVFFYPCDIQIPKSGRPVSVSVPNLANSKNFHDFNNYDLRKSWDKINDDIIKDRELAIQKSIALTNLLKDPSYSLEAFSNARKEFLEWDMKKNNPIVDLADNFLNKIIGRFNLKVKTELDFEKTEDIKTIKIQTAQGKDIPFEALST
ncbi:MAG: hypothetical protein ACOVOW_07800, partial [Spirosomataceae bacterium]